MNLANALKLRAALVACPPEQFDYRRIGSAGECGCVFARAEECFGWRVSIDRALDLYGEDLYYLIGHVAPLVGDGKSHMSMTAAEATGIAGLTDAIGRLDLILARHGYQPDGTPLETKAS